MLPAIGSIVFWIGVIVASYVVLRCMELATAIGPQQRHRVVQTLAVLVIVVVALALVMAYLQYDAMMGAATDPRSRF